MEDLAQALGATLSSDKATRTQGEEYLRQAAKSQANHASSLLQFATATSHNEDIRLAAAVAFKNLVRRHWTEPQEEFVGDPAPAQLSDEEKRTIKSYILDLSLTASPRIGAQLAEALSAIAAEDFPTRWPELLQSLISRMGSSDLSGCCSVLRISNSVFSRYRLQMKSEALYSELKYVLDNFVSPMLKVFQSLSSHINALSSDPDKLSTLFEAVYYIVEIFYSLSSIELPEMIEDALESWFSEFHNYLQQEAPALDSRTSDDEATQLDNVKASICETLRMFAEKYEEEFQPYVSTFAHDVWNLLIKTDLREGKDSMAVSAMGFLTTLARGVHHKLFQDPGTLEQICAKIVIPNMKFRSEDEQMFEINPMEYMRRDIEGSDSDTRRRMAMELVKSLSERFSDTVTPALTSYITTLLQEYATTPQSKWKDKDTALQLALSLLARQVTSARGATQLNELVNLHDFFNSHVAPELTAGAGNAPAVVQADALKFFTVFRSQLDKQVVSKLFPAIVGLIRAQEVVVHSHAAFAIERVLAFREPRSRQHRFSLNELAGSYSVHELLQNALTNLFGRLENEESRENDYVMKAIMRLLLVSGRDVAHMAPTCIEQLSRTLKDLCNRGTNPNFSHYLFESLAAIIQAVGALLRRLIAYILISKSVNVLNVRSAGSETIPELEKYLFPPFQEVLQQDIQEFSPYVFQLFALLLELRPHPVTQAYMQLLPPVLTKDSWSRKGNVPALVRLLKAYLTKAPHEIVSGNHVQAILGVFQALIRSKWHDHDGFMLINALVESLPLQAWASHLPTVFGEMLTRLQNSPTGKFKRHFAIFFALTIVVLGWGKVAETLESFQSGLFLMTVQQVWMPSIPAASTGMLERKLLAVSGAKLLGDCPHLKGEQAATAWQGLLDAVLKSLEDMDRGDGNEEEGDEDAEPQGYIAAYAALAVAARRESDPCGDINDPKEFLAKVLGRVSSEQPGVFVTRLQQLDERSQRALSEYCSAYSVEIK